MKICVSFVASQNDAVLRLCAYLFCFFLRLCAYSFCFFLKGCVLIRSAFVVVDGFCVVDPFLQ